MKIKELGKTTFCTEKCNGVVLGVINKNSYKKVAILSNRDKKLLDRLTELKAEICKGNIVNPKDLVGEHRLVAGLVEGDANND